MVFQSYHLLDDLTVAENIDLPLSYKDIPKSERQALVADTLDRFNIVGKKDLFPEPTLRWTAAVGWHCTSGDSQARSFAGRRADGQSAFGAGKGDYADVSDVE